MNDLKEEEFEVREKKKGSCLGAIFKFFLVIIILAAALVAVGYFAVKSPTGGAGRIAETILSPFVSKDIKTAMDSTEEFLDKYIELAQSVSDDNNAQIMAEMDDYMNKYQQAMLDMNAINKDDAGIISALYADIRLLRMSEKMSKASEAAKTSGAAGVEGQ